MSDICMYSSDMRNVAYSADRIIIRYDCDYYHIYFFCHCTSTCRVLATLARSLYITRFSKWCRMISCRRDVGVLMWVKLSCFFLVAPVVFFGAAPSSVCDPRGAHPIAVHTHVALVLLVLLELAISDMPMVMSDGWYGQHYLGGPHCLIRDRSTGMRLCTA